MGLRLTEGIEESLFASRTGMALRHAVDTGFLETCLTEGYLVHRNGRLTATAAGRRVLDGILPRLAR